MISICSASYRCFNSIISPLSHPDVWNHLVSSSGLSAGVIAAIVIACVLFVLIIILVIFVIYKFVYLKNKNRPSSKVRTEDLKEFLDMVFYYFLLKEESYSLFCKTSRRYFQNLMCEKQQSYFSYK